MANAVTTPNVKSQTGNRVRVLFGGVPVGVVQSVRFSDSYALESVSGVGDIHVVENVPTRANHSVSVSSMTLFAGNLRDQGVAALNGDDALRGLVFDITVFSRDTGQPLRSAKSCSYDSGTVSIEAHRVVVTNAEFKALDVTGLGL